MDSNSRVSKIRLNVEERAVLLHRALDSVGETRLLELRGMIKELLISGLEDPAALACVDELDGYLEDLANDYAELLLSMNTIQRLAQVVAERLPGPPLAALKKAEKERHSAEMIAALMKHDVSKAESSAQKKLTVLDSYMMSMDSKEAKE